MISCSDCIIYIKNKLKTQNITIRVCPNCYNFWKNPDIIYNEPEKDFSDQNKQQCIQLIYTILKQTVILTHDFIVNNKQSDKITKTYLTRYCLNTESKNRIIEYTNNIKKCNDAIEKELTDIIETHDFIREKNLYKYQR